MKKNEEVWRATKLQSVFVNQARYLIENNYDRLAGGKQAKFLKLLDNLGERLRSVSSYRIRKGNKPLLIVVSRKFISIDKQMLRTEVNDSFGNCRDKNLDSLKKSESKKLLYIILNIEPGDLLRNCSVIGAKLSLGIKGRRGLTIEEGIALVRFYPRILEEKSIYLSASSDLIGRRAPTIGAFFKKGAELFIDNGSADEYFGTPSRDFRTI